MTGGLSIAADCEWLGFRAQAPETPETKLLMAVFHRAVLDCVLVSRSRKSGSEYAPVDPKGRNSAEAYLFNPECESGWAFSLEAVADHLGVELEYLRAKTMAFVAAARADFHEAASLRRSRADRWGSESHSRRGALDRLRYIRSTEVGGTRGGRKVRAG